MDTDYANDSELAISDVIEALHNADPAFIENSKSTNMDTLPKVEIIEQPAPKALRFRYECEGRSAGSIPGVNTTNENKTFPTIKVFNYNCQCMVVVSCVTKDAPYYAHPHNLVGKDCSKGVCTMKIDTETMTCQFQNLGIQCVKKKEVENSLNTRRSIRVDPFRKGFTHGSQPSNIDLNAVRLCFQVFIEGDEPGKFTKGLPPVVSNTIYDKKANTDLQIIRLSDVSCSVAGGKEIILLCEKVAKDDIEVHIVEEKDGQIVWLGKGEFQPSDVHRQYAIPFRTPAYQNLQVQSEVKLKIQLVRPSDNAQSEFRDFTYLPLDSATILVKRKQSKYNDTPSAAKRQAVQAASSSVERSPVPVVALPPMSQQYSHLQGVKVEPRDGSSPMGFPNMSPQHPALSHSPQPLNIQGFPQGMSAHQMQLFQQQATPAFNPSMAFSSPGQVTFGQPQAHQFLTPATYQQPLQQSSAMINNLTHQPSTSNSVIADLDNAQNFFEDQSISENLSGQLRLCEINPNDSGEIYSTENMSTDSFRKYLGE